MKILNDTKFFVALLVMTSALNVVAAESPAASPSLPVLSTVTKAELPAKAAALVGQAATKARSQTTVDVVRSAVGLNPAAATAIVGSIAQRVPEVAPIAAATAVSLVPDQAVAIARVAAAAAPAKAGQIVEAICRVLPKNYKEIANAVAEMAPGQEKGILAGVSTAIPTLTVSINKALAASTGSGTPSVEKVLDQVQPGIETASVSPQATLIAPLVAAPPTVAPPYVPRPTPGLNIDPGSGGSVPAGGRDYAAP